MRRMPSDAANTFAVVDLVAGPGRREGFSMISRPRKAFRLSLSAGEDTHACRTLLLRSFFQQLPTHSSLTEDYRGYLRGEGVALLEEILDEHPRRGEAAGHRPGISNGTPHELRAIARINALASQLTRWCHRGQF